MQSGGGKMPFVQYKIVQVHSRVEKFLKNRHELKRELLQHLDSLCKGPLPDDDPGKIRHLRGRFLCLFRYKIENTRLVYEVDQNKRQIRVLDFKTRDKVYEEQ